MLASPLAIASMRFTKENASDYGSRRWRGMSAAERSAYMSSLASVPRTTKRRAPKMYMKLRIEVELLKRRLTALEELLSVRERNSFDPRNLG